MNTLQLRLILADMPDDTRVVLEVSRADGSAIEAPVDAAALDASDPGGPRLFLAGLGSTPAFAIACPTCAERTRAG